MKSRTWKIEYDVTDLSLVTEYSREYTKKAVKEFFTQNIESTQAEIIQAIDTWVIYSMAGVGWSVTINGNSVLLTANGRDHHEVCSGSTIKCVINKLRQMQNVRITPELVEEIFSGGCNIC